MSVSTGFLDLVIDALAELKTVTARRMFGGAGLYCDGSMFALVADDVLYLKADDTTRGTFEAEGLGPFVYSSKGKPTRMSYWRVPDRLFDDREEMTASPRPAARGPRRDPTRGLPASLEKCLKCAPWHFATGD